MTAEIKLKYNLKQKNNFFRRLETLDQSKGKALAEQADLYENQQHAKEDELKEVLRIFK